MKHFFSKRRNLAVGNLITVPQLEKVYTAGESVTLTGTGFANDAKVLIGNNEVTPNSAQST